MRVRLFGGAGAGTGRAGHAAAHRDSHRVAHEALARLGTVLTELTTANLTRVANGTIGDVPAVEAALSAGARWDAQDDAGASAGERALRASHQARYRLALLGASRLPFQLSTLHLQIMTNVQTAATITLSSSWSR